MLHLGTVSLSQKLQADGVINMTSFLQWLFGEKKKVPRYCCLCTNELKDDEQLRAWNRMLMKGNLWFCSGHNSNEVKAKCIKEDCPDIYNGYGGLYSVRR